VAGTRRLVRAVRGVLIFDLPIFFGKITQERASFLHTAWTNNFLSSGRKRVWQFVFASYGNILLLPLIWVMLSVRLLHGTSDKEKEGCEPKKADTRFPHHPPKLVNLNKIGGDIFLT
jgi:hypothetical protein